MPKDTVVFQQGDEGTTFYILYSGAVKVIVQDAANAMDHGSTVCVLEDGDSFGELALLGNGLRAATAMTVMSTQLLCVEKVAYDNSLHRTLAIFGSSRSRRLDSAARIGVSPVARRAWPAVELPAARGEKAREHALGNWTHAGRRAVKRRRRGGGGGNSGRRCVLIFGLRLEHGGWRGVR